MSDLYKNLRTEFQDPDYRYGYAESFLNTKLATQIKTLREQRGQTQAEVGAAMGIKQPGYRRFEDVNHSVWKTDTLWAIARALGVRLTISFETFGSLPEEKKRLKKELLQRPTFEEDPVFRDQLEEPDKIAAVIAQVGGLKELAMGNIGQGPRTHWLGGAVRIPSSFKVFASGLTLKDLADPSRVVPQKRVEVIDISMYQKKKIDAERSIPDAVRQQA